MNMSAISSRDCFTEPEFFAPKETLITTVASGATAFNTDLENFHGIKADPIMLDIQSMATDMEKENIIGEMIKYILEDIEETAYGEKEYIILKAAVFRELGNQTNW